MLAWRIATTPEKKRAFDGEGARLYGGRWNLKGTRIVYASATLSLAALELFVHLERSQLIRPIYRFAIELPERFVEVVDPELLPRDWRRLPAGVDTARIGSAWAAARTSVALSVPSAIVPEENNLLLNPLHRDIRRVRIRPSGRFTFDPRMLKRSRS